MIGREVKRGSVAEHEEQQERHWDSQNLAFFTGRRSNRTVYATALFMGLK